MQYNLGPVIPVGYEFNGQNDVLKNIEDVIAGDCTPMYLTPQITVDAAPADLSDSLQGAYRLGVSVQVYTRVISSQQPSSHGGYINTTQWLLVFENGYSVQADRGSQIKVLPQGEYVAPEE